MTSGIIRNGAVENALDEVELLVEPWREADGGFTVGFGRDVAQKFDCGLDDVSLAGSNDQLHRQITPRRA